MKLLFTISTLFVFTLNLRGQSRLITGRIIGEDLEFVPGASVFDRDLVEIAKTNLNGQFTVKLPESTNELLFAFIGMEPITLELKNGCDTIEVIMMHDLTYDFMTLKRVDRLRYKRFKRLPELHQMAFEKNIFSTISPCYERVFEYYDPKK